VKLQFFGATRSVSGSLHIIRSGSSCWLLDCGLFQGRRQDMYDCSVAYSDDLGRHDDWLLKNPTIPANTDYVILESTYGNRSHRPYSYAQSELKQNLVDTIAAGGIIVIPTFSVDQGVRSLYRQC
jgi:Cft2 family RNA processing exonuclease